MWALNALTWEVRNMGPMPEKLMFPGRCAISEIDGQAGATILLRLQIAVPSLRLNHDIFLGILLRNGFWFNLVTETWEAKRFPPRVLDGMNEPDALFRFRWD